MDLLSRLIDKRDRLVALELTPDAREALLTDIRVELTHGSLAVQGNALSLKETRALVIDEKKPKGKPPEDVKAAINHDIGISQILNWAESEVPITVAAICDLHRILMRELPGTAGGHFRDERVEVTGATKQPVRPERIEESMDALVRSLTDPVGNPAIGAATAHYDFTKIHPFADGNGRTARLLMNWVLLRSDFPLTVLAASDSQRYLDSLAEADAGVASTFYSFQLECAENSLDRFLALG